MRDAVRRLDRWVGPLVFMYGAVVAAVFAFGIYGRHGAIDPIIDLNGFGQITKNIVEGKGFSFGYGPTVRRGPFYPYVGSVVLGLFGGDAGRPEAVFYRPLLVANCLLFGLTTYVVWHTARRVFGPRAALATAALCPLLPQSIRYVGMTEVETLMSLWYALLAATGLSFVTRPTAKSGAAFGLSAAAATLTKPIVMLYPVFLLPLAVWHWRRAGIERARWFTATAILSACFVLPLAPWSLRNMSVTGGEFKGISSNAPAEFLRGYVNAQPKYYLLQQDFGGSPDGPKKWDPEANEFEEALLSLHGIPFYRAFRNSDGSLRMEPDLPPGKSSWAIEVEKDRIESVEMKRRLLHEPVAFVRKFVVQLGTFWYLVETRKKSLFVGSLALAILVLSVVAVRRAPRSLPVWPILAVVVYVNGIYAAFLALARYSMPLFPTLSILAGAGAVALFDRLTTRVRAAPGGELNAP